MKNPNSILHLFEEKGGVLTTQDLVALGVTHYRIRKLIHQGHIETIKRGVYKLSDVEVSEFAEVTKMVPEGIFCLYSAALLHELTTFVPSEYHLAIPKKQKVTLTKHPPVQLYYWKDSQYTLGIENIEKESATIRVYDKEKTVCDFLKFRNRVGIDTAKEVLKTYLKMDSRNMSKLEKYSRKLRLHSIVTPYLTILL